MKDNVALSLKNVSFGYSCDKKIIEDFSLDVEGGSFTTLLGESGSGKTTLLRMISGFLEPNEGSILLDGKVMNGVAPDRREIGIVFQDYALFPHMTVEGNISYGLKVRHKGVKRLSKDEINAIVHESAKSLGIEALLGRYPHELSGGQQQRVSLARALVLKPKVLLMDEPLSSLDSNLRVKVREELKEIQQNLKITTIYVTHDQSEALSLSDRIAVLNQGKLLQYDSPRQLYFKPGDRYTADFIGRSNFLSLNDGEYLVRPEWFCLNKGTDENAIEGTIVSSSFLGEKTSFVLENELHGRLVAELPTLDSISFCDGAAISVSIIHKWKL